MDNNTITAKLRKYFKDNHQQKISEDWEKTSKYDEIDSPKVLHREEDYKYKPPFRVGKKQGKAVLDANGLQLVFFHSEELAQEYCDFKNNLYLDVPDIRNKLSPVCHLVALIEKGEFELALASLKQVKKSVNYLAARKVYE